MSTDLHNFFFEALMKMVADGHESLCLRGSTHIRYSFGNPFFYGKISGRSARREYPGVWSGGCF
jgi:hypothetical protein